MFIHIIALEAILVGRCQRLQYVIVCESRAKLFYVCFFEYNNISLASQFSLD